jgi:predicted enzyme related to lactoylglutathione lyase
MTSDPEGAVAFFKKVVGWGTEVWEGAEEPYTMWTNGGEPLGGVMQIPEEVATQGVPPHWIAYIATPDVDATVAQAVELGGEVAHPPEDVPSAGRFAVLADPQGAVFAVYTAQEDSPIQEGPPKLGQFSWHELATGDYEAAFDFYRRLFGWEKGEAIGMGEMGTYQIYGQGTTQLGGMFNKPPEMPGPPAWLYYVSVKDVHAAVEAVTELGGQVLNGPMQVPDGDWIAQCFDPQGGVFALHSVAK